MPKSTVFGRGGFLTLGKVNGAKIDRFFFLERGVLDIREGQRCQNRPFFLGRGGFLTLGKVNGAKIDRFFLGGKKKAQRKIGAKIDRFSGGEGGGQI